MTHASQKGTSCPDVITRILWICFSARNHLCAPHTQVWDASRRSADYCALYPSCASKYRNKSHINICQCSPNRDMSKTMLIFVWRTFMFFHIVFVALLIFRAYTSCCDSRIIVVNCLGHKIHYKTDWTDNCICTPKLRIISTSHRPLQS